MTIQTFATSRPMCYLSCQLWHSAGTSIARMEIEILHRRGHRDHRGKPLFSLRPLRSLWLILLFAACIPASPPTTSPRHTTQGRSSRRDTYRNDRFSLAYPTGWRVITSPAGAPPSVTFVAPGDCALIFVSSAPLDQPPTSPSCDQPDIRTTERDVMLGGGQIVHRRQRARRRLGRFSRAGGSPRRVAQAQRMKRSRCPR